MASAAETLAIWEELAKRGEEDLLPPDMREAFDEARRQGLIKDTRNVFARNLSPRREDFPEYPAGDGTVEGALAAERQAMQSGLVRSGVEPSVSTDAYGNPIIVTERGSFYPNKPGLSVGDITGLLGSAEQTVKEVAPFIAGGAITAPARALVGAGVQGLTGFATESMRQGGKAIAGEETDLSQLWKTPTLAAAGDILGRGVAALASSILTKVRGKKPDFPVFSETDGSLTPKAIEALEKSGLNPNDFDNIASFELAKMSREGVLTPEQAERFNFFRSQGMQPTRAQVTRSADDFQAQQELAKRSNDVRGALEAQEGQLASAFDSRIGQAGGVSTGSPISDAVLNKAIILDNEISSLYQQAREAMPPNSNIRLGKFFDTLRAKSSSNQATGGIISAVRGYLRDAGIQGGSTTTLDAAMRSTRVSSATPVSVGKAEALRIELNRLYGNANKEGRAVIRSLKDAIDEDVLRVAGKDYFEQARKAKAAFEEGLRPQSLSKFDTNEASLVRDILDNSIRPDDVFQNVVLSRNWKPSDIKELKTYLMTGPEEVVARGAQAWSSLRADTIQYLKDQAFKGPVDSNGVQAFSRHSFESAIRRIGRPRLEAILSAEEVKFLDDIMRVASLREPVRGTAMGRGPSAQAIKLLEDRMNRLPLVGSLWDEIKLRQQTRAMLDPTKETVRAIQRPERIPVGNERITPYAGAAVGVSSSNQ